MNVLCHVCKVTFHSIIKIYNFNGRKGVETDLVSPCNALNYVHKCLHDEKERFLYTTHVISVYGIYVAI